MIEDSISHFNRLDPKAPEYQKPYIFHPSAEGGCSLQGDSLNDPILSPESFGEQEIIVSRLTR